MERLTRELVEKESLTKAEVDELLAVNECSASSTSVFDGEAESCTVSG
jgi:hypothetical protein